MEKSRTEYDRISKDPMSWQNSSLSSPCRTSHSFRRHAIQWMGERFRHQIPTFGSMALGYVIFFYSIVILTYANELFIRENYILSCFTVFSILPIWSTFLNETEKVFPPQWLAKRSSIEYFMVDHSRDYPKISIKNFHLLFSYQQTSESSFYTLELLS